MNDQLIAWVETIVTLPVFLPLVSLVCFIDAVMPTIPAEPVLSLGAAWSGSTGHPDLQWLFTAAVLGTMIGDNTCYIVGQRFQRRMARIRPGSRTGRAVSWIKRTMSAYGGATIIIARFVPYARFTLTLMLGSLNYNWIVFVIYDTIGVFVWAGTVIGVGYVGGLLFQGSPLIGVAVGIVAGTLVGVVIQKAQAVVLNWLDERRAVSQA
ncbi:putative membrane-associated protein [Corynebacterium uterequi]|uniref:Putative membrane-associated protein n=2 Tax=Corynebacterium uterequi TaxID=1072256 RepID=A0A0G3HGG1_9CORY|nr:putative membrane-associated protein [Corynebacterium uterequi]